MLESRHREFMAALQRYATTRGGPYDFIPFSEIQPILGCSVEEAEALLRHAELNGWVKCFGSSPPLGASLRHQGARSSA